MAAVLKTALQVTSDNQLIAFAIALVFLVLARHLKKRNASNGVVITVVALVVLAALAPTLADVYLERHATLLPVRVTVLDSTGRPVDDARVWSSVGGETKRVEGGWEIAINVASLGPDRSVTIHAARDDAFERGRTTVVLERRGQMSAELRLVRDTDGRIRGMIVDEDGRAVVGARVQVAGRGADMVVTAADGSFDLPAHAATGQQVQLHVEKDGYLAANEHHMAGGPAVTIRLRRRALE